MRAGSRPIPDLYFLRWAKMQTLLPQCAVGIDESTAKINESGKKPYFWAMVCRFADYLKNLQVPYLFAPAHCNKQRAACVTVLGGIYTVRERLRMQLHASRIICACRRRKKERQEKARDFRMRIRQMTAEDIPAVAQIEKECFSSRGVNRDFWME